MEAFWKIAIPVGSCLVALAAAAAWHSHNAGAGARKLADEARITLEGAQRGDAEAEDKLGGMYYCGRGVAQSYPDALRWYRAAADQGNVKAEYSVGFLYDKGKGIQQNFPEAYRWYEQAAQKGDRQAECALASMYYDGRGVPQSFTKAALLYRHSADQGLPRAQYDLGYMYYHGQGVSRDRIEGRYWIRKAAVGGDEYARQALGLKLTPFLTFVLIVQALAGFVLVSRPWSFNMWERSEGVRDRRGGFSVWTGSLFLITAALGWYGYTHNLIWCWIYGVTGFALLKWSLDAISIVFLYILFFRIEQPDPGEQQEETCDPF